MFAVPPSDTFTIGDTLTIVVRADSTDQSINGAAGRIVFPSDKLELSDVSTADSIISLWIENPRTASNGSIDFAGVLPNPGFSGSDGQILTATFKAKSAGLATIDIENAQLLANDGEGTDILESVRRAKSAVSPRPYWHRNFNECNRSYPSSNAANDAWV